MKQALLTHLHSVIESATGVDPGALRAFSASGGCIHQSFVIASDKARFFVKINSADKLPVFEEEQRALSVIGATQTIKVPSAISCGVADGRSYLVLEHINMRRPQSRDEQIALGHRLAAMHRCLSSNERHGWEADNFVGSTVQPNEWNDDWLSFWREQRLGWQIRLAGENGLKFKEGVRLLDNIPAFFQSCNYTPQPSLLHGDLWGGNVAFDQEGNPVLFDPASYYGDRETDMAFTELFGGFSAAFYEAYDATWPRHEGWQSRRDLYNLYHVLNHFNLFGGHYGPEAVQLIHSLNQQV